MELNNSHSHSPKNTEEDSSQDLLRAQVAHDLSHRLLEFKDEKKGIKILSAQMGIHEKTLRRLIDGQNKPGYQTLFKIYRTLLQTSNDTTLLELVPEVVKSYLERVHFKGFTEGVSYSLDVEREIQKDPIFCDIYVLCGAGMLTLEYIHYHFGIYGEKVLQKMLDQKVVVAVGKNQFTLGTNQASLTPETLKQMALHLIDTYGKPENSDQQSENYQGLYADGLTEEAYIKWIEIDQKAFREKVALTKDPANRGSIKAFTYTTTDTLVPGKKELMH